jgi:hypothetical protein
MAVRRTISVLLYAVLCSLCAAHNDYKEAFLAESHTNADPCCRTVLDLRSSFPSLTHAVTGTILSRFTLVAQDSQSYGTLQRCPCTPAEESSLELRFGFWRVPFRFTDVAYQEHECAVTFHEPVVLIPVATPSLHFGHQMSTIVTALAAVKLHLGKNGLDITKFPVWCTYENGEPGGLNPNIRGILLALGFSNMTVLEKYEKSKHPAVPQLHV